MAGQSEPNNIVSVFHAKKKGAGALNSLYEPAGPSDTEVSGAPVKTAGGAVRAVLALNCRLSCRRPL